MKPIRSEKLDKEAVKRFNTALRFLSEKKGLSQRKIASLMGESQSSISRIANGATPLTINFAILFEHYTEISSKWLMSGEGSIFVNGENAAIFSDEEINLFSNLKSDKLRYEIVKIIAKTKIGNLEILKKLLIEINK
ncbi:helix-turn-helix domain-containing protein [Leptospira kmetyi]|uniref:helix-turn-helix domain-containing protein n=1 Tax=Leptospira kmetyi TaxID=408139 RepID=UPI000289114D|nr:helix-turn-helix transcriptional regulator [Leptospira kmetyi]